MTFWARIMGMKGDLGLWTTLTKRISGLSYDRDLLRTLHLREAGERRENLREHQGYKMCCDCEEATSIKTSGAEAH